MVDVGVRDDGSRCVEVACAVPPADHDRVDAVFRGALDVMGSVADHQHAFGQRSQLGQRVCDDVALGGAGAVEAGAGDDLEVLVEPEMSQDPSRGGLRLRGGDRQPDAGGAQRGKQGRDAVEQLVHLPAAGRVVGAVRGNRGVGVLGQSHLRERVVHRRTDNHSGQVAVGNRSADRVQGVAKTRHDALRGIGQGAVEVEDHQLRAGCHHFILPQHYCRDVARPLRRAAARYHGDQAAVPGMVDFAVNVRADRPPPWLTDRLAARLTGLGRYPSAADERRAVGAVAARHGRETDEVALLAGAAEGFALLAHLQPRLAALIAPSFTEPEAALSAAGVPFEHVVLAPPFDLTDCVVPDEADLVVVGNPTNPTSVLHTAEQIRALRGPGRIVVVDEAFGDAIPGEPASLAADSLPDVVVLRSLTKTWALAGLRVGYALGPAEVLDQMTARRPHWPLGTLALEAIAACSSTRSGGRGRARRTAAATASWRDGRGTDYHRRRCRRGIRAVRPVHRSRCRPDAKAFGQQGYCGAALRHVRRSGRRVPARGRARGVAACWSTRWPRCCGERAAGRCHRRARRGVSAALGAGLGFGGPGLR